jgi:hypothetical protein
MPDYEQVIFTAETKRHAAYQKNRNVSRKDAKAAKKNK